MAQDIREKFKAEPEAVNQRLRLGHERRFIERLEKELPKRRKLISTRLLIAASVVVFFGIVGYYVLGSQNAAPVKTTVVEKKKDKKDQTYISLGDLSPDLKKIENYYVVNINLELSRLEVSEKNKTLVESFMTPLSELNNEYKKLNGELNKIGPNEQTITAMIKNLQLRLQLMHKLREKLNQLKSSKNETVTEASI